MIISKTCQKIASWGALIGAVSAVVGCTDSNSSPNDLSIQDSKVAVVNKISSSTQWMDNGAGVYVVTFDNLEQKLTNFCKANPKLSIVDISKFDENGLYSRADKLIILTREKVAKDTATEVASFDFDDNWPSTYRNFLKDNPDKTVTATVPADQDGLYSRAERILVIYDVDNKANQTTIKSSGQ
jgi:hypothetical protein